MTTTAIDREAASVKATVVKGKTLSNTHFGELREHDEAFFLPAHGLFADWESAAGCVRLPDDFAQTSTFTQIKILGDWKREMAAQQAAAFVALFRNATAAAGKLSLTERIAQFRSICAEEGVDCPDEIADLLLASGRNQGC